MFGNVTALEGLHVIREKQELKHDDERPPPLGLS